jgi:hypothetical protein
MTLRVVGAGLGRTGTNSLKLALESLLGEPCYHMFECFERPEHMPLWTAAAQGDIPEWDHLLSGYGAAIDFPPAAFWPELMRAYPKALILLSVRDTDDWWKSASRTIFPTVLAMPPGPRREMIDAFWSSRFTLAIEDERAAKAAFEKWNDQVRAGVPPERLLEWRPGDGWELLCSALELPVPPEPFPHVNTTKEFLANRAPGTQAGSK